MRVERKSIRLAGRKKDTLMTRIKLVKVLLEFDGWKITRESFPKGKRYAIIDVERIWDLRKP